jgi:hypothetical protein
MRVANRSADAAVSVLRLDAELKSSKPITSHNAMRRNSARLERFPLNYLAPLGWPLHRPLNGSPKRAARVSCPPRVLILDTQAQDSDSGGSTTGHAYSL